MNKTTIEWTDYTWNPVTGCHKVSPGCKNCYAETLTNRFAKTWGVKSFRDVVMHEDRLSEPEKNKKKWAGKKVFVCSMSDLFQEDVPFEFIAKVYSKMYAHPNTTFQILTKRPKRALEFYNFCYENISKLNLVFDKFFILLLGKSLIFPPPNIWIGTSCENQETANDRISYLLKIPAIVRFLSCEPLLGAIDICQAIRVFQNPNIIHTTFFGDKIHWVISGGESGRNARPMHPNWVRSLRDQCAATNVPFFFKQWGEYVVADQMAPELLRYLKSGRATWKIGQMTTMDNLTYHFHKVGKAKSDKWLDGKQHLEFPKP